MTIAERTPALPEVIVNVESLSSDAVPLAESITSIFILHATDPLTGGTNQP
jgi:hypothetical protein